jgi:four helix bundle protein
LVIEGEKAMRDEKLADELEDRLIDFAVRIIKVADALPKTKAGKHVSDQLLRCGTAAAPHYAEARGSESRADFVHKLKIALKELNESSVWLRIVCRAELIRPDLLTGLLDENQQLCRIFNASVTTAKSNTSSSSNDQ